MIIGDSPIWELRHGGELASYPLHHDELRQLNSGRIWHRVPHIRQGSVVTVVVRYLGRASAP